MRKDPRVALYVRVSTGTQSVDPQELALRKYCEERDWTQIQIFKDPAISGMKDRRPGLDALMDAARRRAIDVVLIWKLDRLGRSLLHLVQALEEFRQLGIDFISTTECFDTSTPHGRLLLNLTAMFANFERDLISERVKLGLANARQKGKRLGRPPIKTLDHAEAKTLLKERASGKATLRQLARKYGVSLWCVHTICNRRRHAEVKSSVFKRQKSEGVNL
jgi:DNA invertase Pin-like site-specific DNA recombinase